MAELIDQLSRYRASDSMLDDYGRQRAPTDEELSRTIIAPGTDALLPIGVTYQAGWEPAGDGIARHARAAVRALSKAGIAVSLQSLPIARMMLEDEIDPSVIREVGYLRSTSVGRALFAVRQVILHNHQFLENVVVPAGARLSDFENELKVYRSTIVYTSWERSTVHPELVAVLNRCARVWVPCEMNRAVFVDAGVERVDVIPCPFEPETSLTAGIAAPRGSESVPEGKRFYAIGKWEPRKNYDALIGAFMREFTQKEKASLFLKTHEWGSWENYPTVKESLERWLADPAVIGNGWTRTNYNRRLRIVTTKIPDEKILGIHRDNNIYVTGSHGEAWDLPAFDARVAGNRLVYTGYGGAEDYASSSDVQIGCDRDPPAMFFEPVHAGYGWEPDALWAEAGVEGIRCALRRASPPARRVLPPELYARFGSDAVGRLMVASLMRASQDAAVKLIAQGSFG